MKKLRVALIGFGGMGHFHASQYKDQEFCKLVAICDKDKKQFEKKEVEINIGNSGKSDLSDVKHYYSYSSLVKNEKFDVLDICLPCYLHARYAIKAMLDGYHVICEKPMARSVAQADRMIATSKKTSKKLMIAQCLRFVKAFQTIKAAYDSKEYGRLLRFDMRRNGSLPKQAWYRDPKKSGGALLDLHLHDTDFIQSMLGTPDSVITFGTARNTGGIDDLITNYIYKDGPFVSSEGSWCRGSWYSSVVAVFEKATLDINGDDVRIAKVDEKETSVKCPGKNGYFNEIAYFTECILKGVEPVLCMPESTRESIRVAAAEERSARRRGAKIPLKK